MMSVKEHHKKSVHSQSHITTPTQSYIFIFSTSPYQVIYYPNARHIEPTVQYDIQKVGGVGTINVNCQPV